MSGSQDKPITAYKPSLEIQPQQQDLPGLDSKMAPEAEHTKQEVWDANGQPSLREYIGSGKLEGKKAIITGGDSGIGRAVAVFFAREGADVSIVYLPQEEKDAKMTGQLIQQSSSGSRSGSRSVNFIAIDLSNASAAKQVVDNHMKKFNQLDILINNASVQMLEKSITDLKDENMEHTFSTNILQMIRLARESVPHMKRGASIINTTSVTAYAGSPSLIDYSSTKGAIVAFTRSLAVQLAPKGIRVNGIAPGPIYTPLQPASRPKEQMEGWGMDKVPLHGRAGQPAELGEAYVFLAGPGGNYITGSVIHVNAGQHIGGS